MDNAALVRSAFYNNDGVQHMNKGCYDDAIAALTLALEILRPVSVCVDQQQQHQQAQDASVFSYGGVGGNYYHHQQQEQREVSFPHHQHQQQPRQPQHFQAGSNLQRPQNTASSSNNTDENGNNSFVSGNNNNICYQHNNTSSSSSSNMLMLNMKERTQGGGTSAGGVEQQPDQHTNFIFRDPIDIPVQSIIRSPVNEKMVTKLSIVVMYNLGLSFHLSAVETCSFDRVVRARMLYEYAFEMHMEEGCDVTLLYTLALMNNLGLIYHLLGENERSYNCFQNMLSTMMFLLEADDARKIKQWDGLLSNVFAYVFLDSKVAAPAA